MTRSGHKTSAGGACRGATAKKAIGEMLDLQVADMKKEGKGGKAPKEPKTNKDKEKDPDAEAAKKFQKDIKALLN